MSTTSEHLAIGHQRQQAGDFEGAERAFREAVLADPGSAEAHNSLGILHARRGERAEALACFRRAVAARPDFVHGHNNAANVLKELGRFDEAEACYREAIRVRPDFAEVLNNLGDLLRARGALEEAEACCRRAVGLKPDHAESHNNLGAVLAAPGRFADAVASFREAVRLAPGQPLPLANLGWALAEAGAAGEAALRLREAAALAPEQAEVHKNLATVLSDLGRAEEALASCREALRIRPDDPDALGAHGLILSDLGRYDEALEAYARVVALAPDRREARRNRALLWLLRGELDRGWAEYEWRWGCKGLPHRPFPQPEWDGSLLGGRTILLHAEQGLGDTIQFIRYAPMVRARGGRVIVAAQPALLPLLEGCAGIDRLVGQGDPIPPFDLHAPLLSLPRIFRTTLADIPARVPYLAPDPRRTERWRREVDAVPGFKVGIAWQGNPKHRRDFRRSFPLARLAPLAKLPGVRLVSLQKGAGREQVAGVAGDWPLIDPGDRLDEGSGPFLDTAALIASLDLVVACDSAVAHLAGALGMPVWLALPFSPDWRWLLDRDDSPWYPTARLFRQARPDDWGGVFERIAGALSDRLGAAAHVGPIAVEIAPGELLDKIAILEIKAARIEDPARLRNVRVELAMLAEARDRAIPRSAGLDALVAELRGVNEALWEIEDEIRLCEHQGDFGARFIELARSVYRTNDRRAALKRAINDRLGSRLVEEKSYRGGEEPGRNS